MISWVFDRPVMTLRATGIASQRAMMSRAFSRSPIDSNKGITYWLATPTWGRYRPTSFCSSSTSSMSDTASQCEMM